MCVNSAASNPICLLQASPIGIGVCVGLRILRWRSDVGSCSALQRCCAPLFEWED